jgi:hypothetical protein
MQNSEEKSGIFWGSWSFIDNLRKWGKNAIVAQLICGFSAQLFLKNFFF